MNLREGTRRLALLLGVAGAIGGGFVSYLELQETLSQRARYTKFQQLAASDVVKQELRTLQTAPDFIPETPQTTQAQTPQIDPKTGERVQPTDAWQKAAAEYSRAHEGHKPPPLPKANVGQDNPKGESVQLDWSTSIPLPSQVNKAGIATINWSHDYGVASIETADGETIYPTPAPSAWLYLLIALFPILGFFIPWGVVRAVGWVGAGFVHPSGYA